VVHKRKSLPVKNLEMRMGLPLDCVQLNLFTVKWGLPSGASRFAATSHARQRCWTADDLQTLLNGLTRETFFNILVFMNSKSFMMRLNKARYARPFKVLSPE